MYLQYQRLEWRFDCRLSCIQVIRYHLRTWSVPSVFKWDCAKLIFGRFSLTVTGLTNCDVYVFVFNWMSYTSGNALNWNSQCRGCTCTHLYCTCIAFMLLPCLSPRFTIKEPRLWLLWSAMPADPQSISWPIFFFLQALFWGFVLINNGTSKLETGNKAARLSEIRPISVLWKSNPLKLFISTPLTFCAGQSYTVAKSELCRMRLAIPPRSLIQDLYHRTQLSIILLLIRTWTKSASEKIWITIKYKNLTDTGFSSELQKKTTTNLFVRYKRQMSAGD